MRERLLAGVAALAVAHPFAVLAVAVAGAGVSVALTPRLEISTSRFELLEPDRENDLRERSDLIVAIGTSDADEGRRVADELARRLSSELPGARHVLHRIDPELFRGRVLLFADLEDLEAILGSLARGGSASVEADLAEADRRFAVDEEVTLDSLERDPAPTAPGDVHPLLRFLDELGRWLDDERRGAIPFAEPRRDLSLDDAGYFVSDDGRTRYVFVERRTTSDRYAIVAPMVERARAIASRISREHPGARIRFTGYPAVAVDEVDAIRRGSVWTGALAFVLVIVIFAYAFRSRAAIVVATIPLALGIAWALGMIVLVVGRLNLLTQAAAPVFAGLGIDFAIHLIAAYERERGDQKPHAVAIARALCGPGKGVVTGALTTSAAFLALTTVGFRAVAELGVVAGAGLALVLALVLFVTPALLTLGERYGSAWLRIAGGPPRAEDASAKAATRFATFVTRTPRTTLVVAAMVTFGCALGIPRVRFDAHIEALLPADAESVVAGAEMTRRSSFSNEYLATTVGSIEEARRLGARLAALPRVGRVESLADLLPDRQAEHIALVEAVGHPAPPATPSAPSDVERVRALLARLARDVSATATEVERAGATATAADLREVVSRTSAIRRRLSEPGARQRLHAFDAALRERASHLRDELASIRPMTLDDLPRALVDRLVRRSADGSRRYAVYVYPEGDLFAEGALGAFVRDVRAVDSSFTGRPRALDSFLHAMARDLRTASLLAIVLVAILLWLDFRRGREVMLALVPIALGAVWLVGIAGWTGIAANMANVAALPLIIGIGVDDGVHLLHFRRLDRNTAAALARAFAVVVLTTATTVAGFGTLGLAAHRGMRSFALVLVIGSTACLLATLFVLPALIELFQERADRANEP